LPQCGFNESLPKDGFDKSLAQNGLDKSLSKTELYIYLPTLDFVDNKNNSILLQLVFMNSLCHIILLMNHFQMVRFALHIPNMVKVPQKSKKLQKELTEYLYLHIKF
jgi:hypothetical protein